MSPESTEKKKKNWISPVRKIKTLDPPYLLREEVFVMGPDVSPKGPTGPSRTCTFFESTVIIAREIFLRFVSSTG